MIIVNHTALWIVILGTPLSCDLFSKYYLIHYTPKYDFNIIISTQDSQVIINMY